jgi:hypothetical protein
MLLQSEDGKLASVMTVSANDDALPGLQARWNIPAERRAPLAPEDVRENRFISRQLGLFDCLSVFFTTISFDRDDPFWGPLVKRADELGGLPQLMPFAAFHQSSQAGLDVITVRVLLNPSAPGFGAALARRPEEDRTTLGGQAQVVMEWARGYRDVVSRAFQPPAGATNTTLRR